MIWPQSVGIVLAVVNMDVDANVNGSPSAAPFTSTFTFTTTTTTGNQLGRRRIIDLNVVPDTRGIRACMGYAVSVLSSDCAGRQ